MTDTTHVCRYPEMRGKVALVTGGTSGIGLATAQGFAREGATVVVTSRNEARAQEALKTFAKDAAVSWIGGDTSDGKSVERLIGEIRKRHGRLDYAFNNAGVPQYSTPLVEQTDEDWARIMDINAQQMARLYNRPNVDNRAALRGLTGASDRLHSDMVDQQYQ